MNLNQLKQRVNIKHPWWKKKHPEILLSLLQFLHFTKLSSYSFSTENVWKIIQANKISF